MVTTFSATTSTLGTVSASMAAPPFHARLTGIAAPTLGSARQAGLQRWISQLQQLGVQHCGKRSMGLAMTVLIDLGYV